MVDVTYGNKGNNTFEFSKEKTELSHCEKNTSMIGMVGQI